MVSGWYSTGLIHQWLECANDEVEVHSDKSTQPHKLITAYGVFSMNLDDLAKYLICTDIVKIKHFINPTKEHPT